MKPLIPLASIAVVIVALFHCGSGRASAQVGTVAPQLHVTPQVDCLLFRIAGLPVETKGFWVLQSSAGLAGWDDLLFFGETAGVPELELANASIPQRDRAQQFFRARHLAVDDPLLRDFLAARDTWRRSGVDSYGMEVFWGVSFLFWHGNVTVRDHEVTAVEVIDTNFFEPPEPRTIDDWFDHLKRAIDQGADQIDVAYDVVFGYPKTVYIDESILIADEEQSWSIPDFLPHR